MKKVEYYTAHVLAMRRGIVPHPVNVTSENVDELLDADFVFLAMDTGPDKKAIIETLTANGIPFIDTGVGLSKDPNGIAGQIRITTSTPGRSDHIDSDGLISYFAGDDAEYDTNLQVDELNALTANLAIIRYKKFLGFYADVEDERHTVFVVNSGDLHHRYGTSDDLDGRGDGGRGGDDVGGLRVVEDEHDEVSDGLASTSSRSKPLTPRPPATGKRRMKAMSLNTVFTESIPAQPEPATFYISMEYQTAVHLCACGCGAKVVTPLGPKDWILTFDGTVSAASFGRQRSAALSVPLLHPPRPDRLAAADLGRGDPGCDRSRSRRPRRGRSRRRPGSRGCGGHGTASAVEVIPVRGGSPTTGNLYASTPVSPPSTARPSPAAAASGTTSAIADRGRVEVRSPQRPGIHCMGTAITDQAGHGVPSASIWAL